MNFQKAIMVYDTDVINWFKEQGDIEIGRNFAESVDGETATINTDRIEDIIIDIIDDIVYDISIEDYVEVIKSMKEIVIYEKLIQVLKDDGLEDEYIIINSQ